MIRRPDAPAAERPVSDSWCVVVVEASENGAEWHLQAADNAAVVFQAPAAGSPLHAHYPMHPGVGMVQPLMVDLVRRTRWAQQLGMLFFLIRGHAFPGPYHPDWRTRPDLLSVVVDHGVGTCR